MKNLIILHGPMGVGKTTVSRALADILQPNVWLDGDWCWQMKPFVANQENREMALRHMIYLLNSFLHNRNFSYVLFSWVIPEDKIFQNILPFLDLSGVFVHKIALLCSPEALKARLQNDVKNGLRTPDVIERGLSYLSRTQHTASIKLDTSALTPEQAAQRIAALIQARQSAGV